MALSLEDTETLSRAARLVPHRGDDGEVDGFRVSGMRQGGLGLSCGLVNGDVLHAVNGHGLQTVQDAMEAYNAVKGSQELRLELSRGGTRQEVVLVLR